MRGWRGGHGGGFPDVADRGQARAFGGHGATPAAEPERPHMNDVDGWIYFDGPAPERLRPLLSALRDLCFWWLARRACANVPFNLDSFY
jgi:hypothetical protein